MSEQKPKAKRGFAAMDPAKHRELSARGAEVGHWRGTSHKLTEYERALAHARGGRALAAKRLRERWGQS